MIIADGGSPATGTASLPTSELGIQVPQGDPGALEATASQLLGASGAMERVASILRGNGTLAGWQGLAEASYAGAASVQAAAAAGAATQMAAGAGALQRAAAELAAVQQQVEQYLLEAQDAQRRIDQAKKQIADAQARIATATTEIVGADVKIAISAILPNHPSASAAIATRNQAQQALQQAQGDLQKAQTQLQRAEDDLQRAQQRARQANEQWHTEAQAAAAALHAATQPINSLMLTAFGMPTPFLANPGLPGGVPPVFLGAPLAARSNRESGLFGLDPLNALGGANTLATASVLPFTANAGYQLFGKIGAQSSELSTLPERFGQAVGPLAQAADHGELPWSAVATKSDSFMASETQVLGRLSKGVSTAEESFADGGIPSSLAAPLGGLALVGDGATVFDSGASTGDRVVSGVNGVGTLAALAPDAAAVAGIDMSTGWVPVAGQVVAVGSGVYLGGEWLYNNWTPFHDAVNGAGHFFGHDVPDAAGTVAHYLDPANW